MRWPWNARRPHPFSEQEIERRLPIWQALADLFLDTELQPADYRCIAQRVSGRGFTPDQLRAILADEIAPALAPNLFADIAGEWAGWPEDHVGQAVIAALRDGPSWLLPTRAINAYVAQEWAKVADALGD